MTRIYAYFAYFKVVVLNYFGLYFRKLYSNKKQEFVDREVVLKYMYFSK